MTIIAGAKAMAFIITRDRNVAKGFYGDTLGFALTHEDEFAAVFDLNGTMLRVSTMQDCVAQPYTVLGWEVPDIAGVVDTLSDRGVTFTKHAGFGQDERGIWAPPGAATKIAWFRDPDGNVLSLTQF